MDRVIVGISGGIDSAVTAYILNRQGFEVSGVYLNINEPSADIPEAIKMISDQLQIPIAIRDVSERFKNTVIAYFTKELIRGRTPSPCAICNPEFKWKILEEESYTTKATYLATGHYIQKVFEDGYWYLKKGIDPLKDQSYYLWGLTQNIISKMINPLGEMTKPETRKLANEIGLGFLNNKKESTGLCFAQGLEYTSLIKKLVPEIESIQPGDIMDSSGKILGKHRGYIYYTIGQKRDLNIQGNKNYCVTDIDASKNIVYAGFASDLWKTEFSVSHYSFADGKIPEGEVDVIIRGIGLNPEGPCRIVSKENNILQILLEKPAWAPAPGQPAVFYRNGLLLGGGFII
jgi:tRNA-uridine 2-sulfurtransferase